MPPIVTGPVNLVDTGSKYDKGDQPDPGIALCLSGGGYRAMLFHLGALWRLNEWGYLPRLTRISSVSGGSITAGVLGLHWARLGFDPIGMSQNFDAEVVQPIPTLAGKTIDEGAILGGIFLPGSRRRRLQPVLDGFVPIFPVAHSLEGSNCIDQKETECEADRCPSALEPKAPC